MSSPLGYYPLVTDPGRGTELRAAVARHARRVRAEQVADGGYMCPPVGAESCAAANGSSGDGNCAHCRATVGRRAEQVGDLVADVVELVDEPAPYAPRAPRHARAGQPESVWPALLGFVAVIVTAAVSAAAYLAVLLTVAPPSVAPPTVARQFPPPPYTD